MNLLHAVILEMVIYVKDDRQVLSSVLNTAQISQISIRKILRNSMGPSLRIALQSQLREFDAIESEAHSLAGQRGWELREIQPAQRFIAVTKTYLKSSRRNSDSRIADMVIQSNTHGMIQNLKSMHQYQQQDSQVRILSQRLLDCETASIRQMQSFL